MSDSKLLASGNGMGNPAVSTAWKYGVIEAVCGIVCIIIAFSIQSAGDEYLSQISNVNAHDPLLYYSNTATNARKAAAQEVTDLINMAFYTCIAAGIFCIIWGVCLGNNCAKKVKATNVNVYENKVNGTSLDKDFSMAKLIFMCMGWNKARLTNFDIAFNQITSVDLADNNSIVINASGANYKCFVSNGSEIQTAINNKIRNG